MRKQDILASDFNLKWHDQFTGREFITSYSWSGAEFQAKTRAGHIRRCIAAGKSAGFEYLGMVGNKVEYKTIDTRSLAGLKQAERLQAAGWSIGEVRLSTVQFYRVKPIKTRRPGQ